MLGYKITHFRQIAARPKYWFFCLLLAALLALGIAPAAFAGPLDTWYVRTSGTSIDLDSVTYGNNQFVAVSGSTNLTSPDGVHWAIRNQEIYVGFNCVTYGNGTFVAVGDYKNIWTSPDGATWTNRSDYINTDLEGVTYGENTFVAVGEGGTILTSSNGVDWTSRTSGTANFLNAVTYGNGQFVAVGDNHTILTSPDGATWTVRDLDISGCWFNGVTYGGGTFVAVGSSILTSTDGVNWVTREFAVADLLYGVTYGNGTFVTVGIFGTIRTSPDGATWTDKTSGNYCELDSITYGNGTFVAVGEGGAIVQSGQFTSPYSAQMVSDDIPATMTAGQSYTVHITVKNTGTNTWTAANGYKLGAVGGSDPFAATRQLLGSTDSIATGQSKTFTFTMKAPATPGTYTTDWQMIREGTAWFGDTLTRNVTVTATTPYSAQITGNTIPSTMTAGQTYSVTVTVQNTGSNTWTAANNYKLGAVGGSDPFAATRQLLGSSDSITTGQSETFTFNMKSPRSC